MQLIGLQGEKRVPASLAQRGMNYHCPECSALLRLRAGLHRQLHFYHFSKNSSCFQSGKTLSHLQTQLYIQKNLPPNQSELEVPFPAIGRIADVVWFEKNLVFEVQCSPISQEEVERRNRDYESLGYRVVWILHDSRFNQQALSSAENHLLGRDMYFTSINRGQGGIYDQFSLVLDARRLFRGVKLPIDLSHPYYAEEIPFDPKWPKELQRRAKAKLLGFQGDLLDRLRSGGDYLTMKLLENHYAKPRSLLRKIRAWLLGLKAVYASFLHALLEKNALQESKVGKNPQSQRSVKTFFQRKGVL